MITWSVAHSRSDLPTTALVAVVIASLARAAGEKKPGPVGDLITRFMGLIVLAMGVQFALMGVKQFFHGRRGASMPACLSGGALTPLVTLQVVLHRRRVLL